MAAGGQRAELGTRGLGTATELRDARPGLAQHNVHLASNSHRRPGRHRIPCAHGTDSAQPHSHRVRSTRSCAWIRPRAARPRAADSDWACSPWTCRCVLGLFGRWHVRARFSVLKHGWLARVAAVLAHDGRRDDPVCSGLRRLEHAAQWTGRIVRAAGDHLARDVGVHSRLPVVVRCSVYDLLGGFHNSGDTKRRGANCVAYVVAFFINGSHRTDASRREYSPGCHRPQPMPPPVSQPW